MDDIDWSNVYSRSPRKQEGREAEELVIMAEILPNVMKCTVSEMGEAQWACRTVTRKHAIAKLMKTTTRKSLRKKRKSRHVAYRRTKMRVTANFSGAMRARRARNGCFQAWEKRSASNSTLRGSSWNRALQPRLQEVLSLRLRGSDPRQTLGLAKEWGAPETGSLVTIEEGFPRLFKKISLK